MKYEINKDKRGEWRWKFKASNGKTIAQSSEGYKNKQDCENGIRLVKDSTDAPIE